MSNTPRVSHLAATMALVGACALWGTSFSTVKLCGEAFMAGARPGTDPEFGPVLLTATRFTLALPLLFLFWRPVRKWRLRRRDTVPLLKVSIPMAVAFLVQAAGLASVPATLSGFITGLCVCFTPGFEWLLHGRRPTWRLVAGVLLALAGVSLMTLTADKENWSLNRGVGLTFLCVLAFTIQIVYTGESSERIGAVALTTGSFDGAGLMIAANLIVALKRSRGVQPGMALRRNDSA